MGLSIYHSMTEPPSPPNASAFSFEPKGPLPRLSFPLPSRPTSQHKRFRSLSDVDGEHSRDLGKKKRRLRRFLITSRLSRPFSSPASNIVDRGSSKIAVWAKQKALGRNVLRKAAIMNHIRLRRAGTQTGQQQPPLSPPNQEAQEMVRQTFMYGSPDTYTHPVVRTSGESSPVAVSPNFAPAPALVRGPSFTRETSSSSTKTTQPSAQVPRRDYIPLPPSPLGLSNYDALDTEDEFSDDDEGGCDWFSGTRADSFGEYDNLEPEEAVVDDYDDIEAFASPQTSALMEVTKAAEAERLHEMQRRAAADQTAEIQKEQQRQRNFAFVRFEQ